MSRGLAILMFHRVAPVHDPLRVRMGTVDEFRSQMRILKRFFRPVSISEGLRLLEAGRLPERSVAVTFDDGYADNARLALPVLQEVGVPAAFFVATGYLEGGRMWNDTVLEAVRRIPPGRYDIPALRTGPIELQSEAGRRPLAIALLKAVKHLEPSRRQAAAEALASHCPEPLPQDLMMRREDVRALADAGMEVGGHTRTHPILRLLGDQEAEAEICGGIEDLRAITGRPVTLFAYPNGRRGEDYSDREVTILERVGIEAALVSNRGIVTKRSHRLQLPRLNPLHRAPLKFGYALWQAYREPEWNWQAGEAA